VRGTLDWLQCFPMMKACLLDELLLMLDMPWKQHRLFLWRIGAWYPVKADVMHHVAALVSSWEGIDGRLPYTNQEQD
jgi:hypothetical protein